MAFLIKGLPPGSHTNAALPENELDAEYFNILETVMASIDTLALALKAFAISLDTSIQFLFSLDDTSSGPISTPVDIVVAVTTGDGVIEPFTPVVDASVEILVDGTLGTTATIDGGAGPILKAFVDGKFTISLDASSLGSVTLGIVSPHASGLDITDTHTHTFVP